MLGIEVSHVGMTFDSHGPRVRALEDISFSVEPSQFFSIVGPSGCGKTTLLRMIGDLAPTTEGKILIGGDSPAAARREHAFSWVFQTPVLLPWRTVLGNVRLPLEIVNVSSRTPQALLKLAGLEGFEQRRPAELSGGMQQRVALARALTFDPKILLMDEPFAAVDEFTRNTLNVELLRIWREVRLTVLFVTHSIAEAVFLSDQVLVLSARPGRLKAIIDVPLARPRDNAIRQTNEFREFIHCIESHLSSE